MENLFGEQSQQIDALIQLAWTMVVAYIPKVILAIITLLVGLWLIGRLTAVMDRKLEQRDPTLNKFVTGLVSVILKILLAISVASMVGIATTSFIAVLGAAGLAIGLALQGSLSNFAGGVLILIFKPFRVGDAIEAQGFLGSVTEIQILYTIMTTFDGCRVVIPNGNLSNSNLTNYSVYQTRRCDMTFRIGYGDDIKQAKAILKRLVEADERTLADPEPLIIVSALGVNSVDFAVRVWTKAGDVWPYNWDMQEKVKEAFDAEGVSIPFPQQDIHLHQASAAG